MDDRKLDEDFEAVFMAKNAEAELDEERADKCFDKGDGDASKDSIQS